MITNHLPISELPQFWDILLQYVLVHDLFVNIHAELPQKLPADYAGMIRTHAAESRSVSLMDSRMLTALLSHHAPPRVD